MSFQVNQRSLPQTGAGDVCAHISCAIGHRFRAVVVTDSYPRPAFTVVAVAQILGHLFTVRVKPPKRGRAIRLDADAK